MRWGDYLHKAQVEECVCVFFFCFCLCCYVFPPGPTQYIFHTPVTRYSLFVLKVPLNTNKTNRSHHAGKHELADLITRGWLLFMTTNTDRTYLWMIVVYQLTTDSSKRPCIIWSSGPFSSSICRPVPATCSMRAPWQTLELFHQGSGCVKPSASWPADTWHFAGRF